MIVTQHIEKDQLGQSSELSFCYFLNGCYTVFSSISVQNVLKSDIVFSKYYDFIDDNDIITDQWKVDFEEKFLICVK